MCGRVKEEFQIPLLDYFEVLYEIFELHNMVNIFFCFCFWDDQFDFDFQFAGFIGFLSRVLTQMKMFFDD